MSKLTMPNIGEQGLKRFDMAVKCFRQALQSLKESSLSDNQKTLKSHEITAIIKELRDEEEEAVREAFKISSQKWGQVLGHVFQITVYSSLSSF